MKGRKESDEGGVPEAAQDTLWPWLHAPLAQALQQLHSHAVLLHGPEGVVFRAVSFLYSQAPKRVASRCRPIACDQS